MNKHDHCNLLVDISFTDVPQSLQNMCVDRVNDGVKWTCYIENCESGGDIKNEFTKLRYEQTKNC